MSARPGRISEVIDIDLPQPRDEDTRETRPLLRARHRGPRGAPRAATGRADPDRLRGARPRRGRHRVTAATGPDLVAGGRLPSASRAGGARWRATCRRSSCSSAVLVALGDRHRRRRPARHPAAVVDLGALRSKNSERAPWTRPSTRSGRRSAGSSSARPRASSSASPPRAGRSRGTSCCRSPSARRTIPIIAIAPLLNNWFGVAQPAVQDDDGRDAGVLPRRHQRHPRPGPGRSRPRWS